MNRIARSWNIFKTSMSLIMREKKLLIFPFLSFCAMIMLIALIAAGGFAFFAMVPDAANTAQSANADTDVNQAQKIINIVIYFVIYLATMLVTNFCTTAFFHEIFRGLRGEPVSVGRGFSFAMSRIGAIFLWSLLAATVGVLLKVIQEKSNFLGKIILQLVGFAWAVVACFAIPVIVFHTELTNPIQVLRCSGTAIKRTWGEALVGYVGIGVLQGLAAIGLVLGFVGGILLVMAVQPVAGFTLICVTLFVFFCFCYLVATAEHVYQAALYLYSEQENTNLYPREVIDTAFRNK